jgi:outer membrane protein assembly factor BamB
MSNRTGCPPCPGVQAPAVTAPQVFLAGMLLLFSLVFLAHVLGREEPPALEPPPSFSQFLLLPTDPHLNKRFTAVEEYIRAKSWVKVVRVLQTLLDEPADVFLTITRKGEGDKEITQWLSARAEANRLLAALPAEGLAFYELTHGPKARALLKEAQARKDHRLLASIVQRYRFTQAGNEAVRALAGYYFDRGEIDLASRYFAFLVEGVGERRPAPPALFQAAVAFQHCGEHLRAEAAWKRLVSEAPHGIRLGGETLSLDDLEKHLAPEAAPAFRRGASEDWLLFGGDPSRSAEGRGAATVVTPGWQLPTIQQSATREWLQTAAAQQESRGQPVLPASSPLLVAGRAVYRTAGGVAAADLRTGALAWSSTTCGLDTLVESPADQAHLRTWVQAYLPGHPQVLFDNSVLGSLSSDGTRIYAVEDLPVPPFPSSYANFHERQGEGLDLTLAPDMTDAVYHSRLLAIKLASGSVVWECGGRRGQRTGLFRDCFFLGAPLPLGGELYALLEKEGDLYLACLDPATGTLLWSQRVAMPGAHLLVDGARRRHALHLTHVAGMLICPTNSGGVVAFDLGTRSLAWAYAYRPDPPLPAAPPEYWRGRRRPRPIPVLEPPNLEAHWLTTAPLIHDGKVLLASPDEPVIHCLQLHNGQRLWTAPREEDDLFVASVCQGKVLVIGKKRCRALGLSDGKPAWAVETETPSGRGVVSAGLYYLPVKAASGPGGEVLAIDVDPGSIRHRIAWPGQDPPGNLVLSAGTVLSQTASTLAAYPQQPPSSKP